MPPDKTQPGSAADWLRRSYSDLSLASIPLPEHVLYNDLCFHAQQAVEKSIKAVLIHYGIEFRKVHDIDHLLALLPRDVPSPPASDIVVSLTSYAVMARYPGDYEDILPEDYDEAILVARSVYAWAAAVIGQL